MRLSSIFVCVAVIMLAPAAFSDDTFPVYHWGYKHMVSEMDDRATDMAWSETCDTMDQDRNAGTCASLTLVCTAGKWTLLVGDATLSFLSNAGIIRFEDQTPLHVDFIHAGTDRNWTTYATTDYAALKLVLDAARQGGTLKVEIDGFISRFHFPANSEEIAQITAACP